MAFFDAFPSIDVTYTIKTDSGPIIATIQDLTTNVGMIITPTDMDIMCFRYTIKDGELPQNLSQRFYNSPDYDWTILYINSIFNLNTDWPISQLNLLDYVSNKYGAANINNVNCYMKIPENVVMDQSFIVSNYGSQYAVPMTNYQWEEWVNEQNRYIYIIKAENISTFVQKFTAAVLS